MKTNVLKYLIGLTFCGLLCASCDGNAFIDDIYVEPQASFSIDDKEYFEVFESVHFTNTGAGQRFAVWPGDTLHVYGKTGNSGYACNSDGTYSYSYQEPGTYTAVWVASSINAAGECIFDIDSVQIEVRADDGGLSSFSITRMGKLSDFGSSFYYESYGDFIETTRIVCPLPYALYPNYICRTLGVKFVLESDFAQLFWLKNGDEEIELISESTSKKFQFDTAAEDQLEPQTLIVRTSSGMETNYEVVGIIIPEFTSFAINGVEAVQTRNVSAFNKFDMSMELPAGTDLTKLVPTFAVMENDPNLISAQKTVKVTVNGIEQTSGSSTVDFSAPVEYVITYSVPGKDNYTYSYETYYTITATLN